MKIIAKTQNGVIAEMSNDEISNLLGYYGQYCGVVPAIGSEVQVNAMFQQLYKIKSLRSTIKKLEDGATELLESIRTKNPVIEPIMAAIDTATPKEK